MVGNRFRNSIKQAKTYPGADIDSDHNPVVCKFQIKLKSLKAKNRSEVKDFSVLKHERNKMQFAVSVRNKYESLLVEQIEQEIEHELEDPGKLWKVLKESLHHARDEEINNNIKRECIIAKENWYNQKCEEIENLEKENKSRELHKEIKELTGCAKSNQSTGCIKSRDGIILLEQEEIQKRWVEYIRELYDDNRGQQLSEYERLGEGPEILQKEQERAEEIKVKLDEYQLEQVDKFIYLGQTITNDGRCEEEIKKRIAIAKNQFSRMKNVLTNKKIKYATRKRLVQCYIWSTLLYGAETWTISKTSEKRIISLEMWVHRKMFKISWKEMKTNVEVLRLVGPNKSLIKIIKERKIRYCGHVLRHDTLQKELLEGRVEGRRNRGRPRKRWFDNIREWTGKSFVECKRDDWRKMIADLLKADGTP
ncbi:putative uncharacterized transposon-derived protein F52C9.6 [Nymphon striatum]|nr:putative uncharacterized transposon-derived protein F52C9.6 [Nymphon striatum]